MTVVTGEAVALDVRIARVPSRLLALMVDLAVIGVLLIGFTFVLGFVGPTLDDGLVAAVSLTVMVLILVGYPTMIETVTRGKSLGKLLAGLRVVRTDGGPIGFRQALVRALCLVFIDLFTTSGFVGLISALSTRKGQRVGDLLAGTIVVRERAPRNSAVLPTPGVPPALQGWASSADLATLPDDVALQVQQLLNRLPQLSPGARQSVVSELAARVSMNVSPPPPPGTPAEVYLAAVVGERSRRAWLGAQGGAGMSTGPTSTGPVSTGLTREMPGPGLAPDPGIESASPAPTQQGPFAPPQ